MDLIAANQLIQLSAEAIGQGGEGIIYPIDNPTAFQSSVAKIYHPRERNKAREYKLNYLISHPLPANHSGAHVWPQEIIYNQAGAFMGFLMPKAKSKYDLTVLCSLKLSNRLEPGWKAKYSREKVKGFENRARVAFYLAQAMADLHASQHYRLVDFKPENIRVGLNGKVNLLDMDSLQIHQDNALLFKAMKVTAEYSPAEIKYVDLGQDLIPEFWDRFSLAVVLYKLLFGLHPYSGTPKGDYQVLSAQAQKIQAGLLPIGKGKPYFEVIPLPHQNFKALPASIQRLFLRAFDEGYREIEARPSAREWAQELEHFSAQARHYQNPIPQKAPVSKQGQEPVKAKKQNNPLPLIIFSLICLAFLYIGTSNRYDFFHQGELPVSELMNIPPSQEGRTAFYDYDREKYGFLDEINDTIIPAKFDAVKPFNNNRAFVRNNSLWGIIDPQGSEIRSPSYNEVMGFINGTAIAKLDEHWGLIDTTGRELLSFDFENIIRHESDDLFIIKNEKKYTLYNHLGKLLSEKHWDYMETFQDDLTKVVVKKRMEHSYENKIIEKIGILNEMGN